MQIHIMPIIILLATLTAAASAINCYSCESEYEPNCGADFDLETHFKLDCARIAPPRYLENELAHRNATACMKRIHTDVDVEYIVRSCYFGDVNDTSVGCSLDPTLESQKLIACHVCANENYCNMGVRTLKYWWHNPLLLAGGILLLLTRFSFASHSVQP